MKVNKLREAVVLEVGQHIFGRNTKILEPKVHGLNDREYWMNL